MQAGVDIGGTFTDLVLSDRGRLRIHKLLSSPQNPAQSMLEGLEIIAPGGISALTQVAHGSTVATNAILERKGARSALITTAGFRDILFIGRQERPRLYDLHPKIPPPLIPRERCYEVPERLDFRGDLLQALDMDGLDAVLDQIKHDGVDSIAVCLLFSYVNDRHEQAIKRRILERGIVKEAWQIVLSSQALPEFREYERASTIALEAYVRPVMSGYISQLEAELPRRTSLRIMKSDGGVMRASRVRQQAIHTALSGPAAGVMGAFYVAKTAGFDKIITLDMGGTSTDVALIDGHPQPRPESSIDDLPLRLRMLDIETIGAGGGSIARVDAGGALRVGPESAGASPGPAVYGAGGEQATLSDANAILGRLDADHFLGGAMALDLGNGIKAMNALARQIGFSTIATAKGVVEIANVNIDRAIRRVSIARGHDPRDFTLVAFGGAGPLHACEAAERLDIPRVLIPHTPGVLCALGLLIADVAVDFSQSVMTLATPENIAGLEDRQGSLLEQARAELRQEAMGQEDMRFAVTVDMRYQGQAYELNLPFSASLLEDFHDLHEATYGHALRSREVEIVNLRVQGTGLVKKPEIRFQESRPNVALPFAEKESPLGAAIKLFRREALEAGAAFSGEALVFQMDSTTYAPPGWQASVDGYLNILLRRG
ncbi:MAG: hydantoinase/oxoprolinase family protein [Chloroflexota bacterium]|nr:hydantoinase/oxoprolinase family protein [Chloroflexota bacterium]